MSPGRATQWRPGCCGSDGARAHVLPVSQVPCGGFDSAHRRYVVVQAAGSFVVVVWGAAFGALPTLTQTVTLRAAGEATDAATAV